MLEFNVPWSVQAFHERESLSLSLSLSVFLSVRPPTSVCLSVSFLLPACLFVHTTPLFWLSVHFLLIPDIINLACPCFQKLIITAYLCALLPSGSQRVALAEGRICQ